MPYEMFMSCRVLTSIIIPENIKRISDRTFLVTGFKSIVIPATVEHIGTEVFASSKLNQLK
jgi:hypothetical protein